MKDYKALYILKAKTITGIKLSGVSDSLETLATDFYKWTNDNNYSNDSIIYSKIYDYNSRNVIANIEVDDNQNIILVPVTVKEKKMNLGVKLLYKKFIEYFERKSK